MTRASKLNDPVLFQRACDLVDEGVGRDILATELNISVDAARGFIQRYEMFGKDGAMCSHTPKVYTQAEKIEAVEYFLAGNSQSETCIRFGLSNRSTLKRWVKTFREEGPAGLASKRKGRPTRQNPSVELTDEQQLQHRIDRLEAENAYLKALAALEDSR